MSGALVSGVRQEVRFHDQSMPERDAEEEAAKMARLAKWNKGGLVKNWLLKGRAPPPARAEPVARAQAEPLARAVAGRAVGVDRNEGGSEGLGGLGGQRSGEVTEPCAQDL